MMDEVKEKSIRVRILQNPFDPSSFIEEEIVYDPNKNLADYLEGLPSPNAWTVGYRGLAIQPKLWKDFSPQENEIVSLVRAPEGGDGGKQILRLVAMIAIAVAAPYIAAAMGLVGTAAAIATAVITVVGSVLVNVLIPPPTPDFSESDFSATDSPSYGIDGPKQTSREGLVLPVVYGYHRVAGNIADIYTQNEGDLQYLYMRTVLNDGQVRNITDIRINDQPIDNFVEVQNRIALGYESQTPNDWFNDAVRLVNRNTVLSNSSWVTHTTDGEVDKLRIDLVAPQGVVEFNDKGDKIAHVVPVEFQFREVGETTWNVLPMDNVTLRTTNVGTFGAIGAAGSGGTFGNVVVKASNTSQSADSLTYDQTSAVEYRPAGSTGAWTALGSQTSTAEGYYDPSWGESGGVVEPDTTHVYSFDLPEDEYEVRATTGEIEVIEEVYQAGSAVYNVQGSSTAAIRRSLLSKQLNRAEYEVRIRRQTAESDDTSTIDALYLSDIGEIDVSPVNLNGVANLSLRIKLSDQISSRPTLSALVEGCLLKKYDRDGNFTVEEWSNNPAWIVIDILTNPLRGAGMALSRFDWDSVVEWAEHCDDQGYTFNGVFDYESNIWDATQLVLRLGHAQFLRMGTKWAFVIDRASDPVTVFNDSNVFMDTLNTNWLPMSERATEIQLSYSDEADSYKRKTIRLVDQAAAQAGVISRVSSYTEMGITNATQATDEAEYQLRRNRLLRKTTTFDAPMEAIALLIGDVAELKFKQADFANGNGGKLAAGSTNAIIQLDREVTIEAGETYKLLVHQPAVKRYDAEIMSIAGNTVTFDAINMNAESPSASLDQIDRLVLNDIDRQVLSYTQVGSTVYLKLDSTSGLTVEDCELWQTNVVEEKEVATSVAGDYTALALTSGYSFVPSQYSSWLFGKEGLVSEKARLIGVDGDDIHTRSLTFIEYNEAMYLPPGADIPDTEVVPVEAPQHVTDLYIDYNKFPTGDTDVQNLTVTWVKPATINYAGADVYVNEDNNGWKLANTVRDVSQSNVPIKDGVNVRVRVVGFDALGRRAPFAAAPSIRFTANYVYRDLVVPTGLAVTETNYDVTGRVKTSWSAPTDEVVSGYRIDVRTLSESDYNAIVADPTLGEPQSSWSEQDIADWNAQFTVSVSVPDTVAEIPNLRKGYYQFRIRAERGRSHSDWVVLTYELQSPTFVNAVTGLQTVDGGTTFGGNAAELVWDDIFVQAQALSDEGLPYILKDYEVQILSLTDEVLRTEHVQEPRYIYSYDKNAEDTTLARARRSFKVSVKARGRQGQESSAQIVTVSNPAPAISGSPAINGQDVTLPVIDDIDSLGYRLWIKETDDINPSTDSYTDIVGNSFTLPAAPGAVMYFRYAPRDAFDDESLSVSGSFSGTARSVAYDDITNAPTSLGDLDSTANQAIIDLQTTYGDTASAAASATAAIAAKEASEAAQTGSETAQAAAETAETGAASARQAAEIAQAAAATSETNASTSETNAGQAATAAAGSASAASTSASGAETSASAAAASQTAASTSAGEALTYRNEAATSATNAETSNIAASTASGVAVSAAVQTAVSDFSLQEYFVNPNGVSLDFVAGTDADLGAGATVNNPTAAGGGINIYQARLVPIVPGDTYRFTCSAKVTNEGDTGTGDAGDAWANAAWYDAAGNYLSDRGLYYFGNYDASGGTLTREETGASILSGAPSGTHYMRMGANFLRGTNGEIFVSHLSGVNVTSEIVASTAASAASTSESNAAISASEAATNASASETSRVAAETAASNASTSETSASTSETNASGSASAAGSSASAAAASANAASSSAADASTSESNAATSESNAAGSASAASSSETNAAASESAAAGSASAASSSASAAATSASEASTSASASEGSRTAAETAASNAATSEGNAAISETNAGTSEANASSSAAAASASETAASSTYDATLDTYSQTLPRSPSTVPTDSAFSKTSTYASANLAATYDDPAEGVVLHWPANNSASAYNRHGFKIEASRTYRATVEAFVKTNPTGDTVRFIFGLALQGADGLYLSTYGWANYQNFDNSDGWVTHSIDVTGADLLASEPTAVYVRTRTQMNRRTSGGTASDGETYVRVLAIEDVTAETAASTSAQAAATSETNAATSADAASTSATAASNSQLGAASSASDAQVFESAAAGSATSAAGSASAAALSATLSASAGVVGGYANNPRFASWTSTLPDGWTNWSTGGSISKETSNQRFAGVDAVKLAAIDTADQGIVSNIYGLYNNAYGFLGNPDLPEKAVISASIFLESGSWTGSGILVQWLDGTTGNGGPSGTILGSARVDFENLSLPTGKWVTVNKMVDVTVGSTGFNYYCMANYAPMGTKSVKNLIVGELNLRAATDEEVEAGRVSEVEASVEANSLAIVQEASARATDVINIQTNVNSNTASINANSTAISNETAARAAAISAVQTEVNNNAASITNNSTAISNEASARATDIALVQAEVSGNTASVSTNATAIANVDGKLEATYGIKVDGSGNASVVLLSNGSTLGSAIILSADVITLDGDVIVTGTITTDRLAANAITNTETDEPVDSDVDEDWATIASISFLSVGIGVELRASVQLYASNIPGSGAGIGGVGHVRLRRDGTTVLREKSSNFNMVNTSSDPMVPFYEGELDFVLDKNDLPSAGTHTYTLEAKMPGNTGTLHTSEGREIFLTAREFKR